MGSLFKYSDKSVVFVYFFLFGLSAITLSFFISTFFSRAKTAVAVGTLSFLGAFFPYYTVNDQAIPMSVLILMQDHAEIFVWDLYVLEMLIEFIWIYNTPRIWKVLASLLSPTAFALGSINFADYERAHVGLRWSNIWRVCALSFYYFYFYLVFWSPGLLFKLWENDSCRHHLGWIFWSVSWWCWSTHCCTAQLAFTWIRYTV